MINFVDYSLFAMCLFILGGSVWISFQTRFVQVRFLPRILSLFKKETGALQTPHTLSPLKALLTSMSTTLGISTIVAPVIAIRLGGPGALLGFLLTAFFGSALTYTEVMLSVRYRNKKENGVIGGGPMPYLAKIFSPRVAKFYALGCLILMMAWSSAQANQLSAILSSPFLGGYGLPPLASGLILTLLVLGSLLGGIQRIGTLSAKLVPLMFILYTGSCLWIVGSHLGHLTEIFQQMFSSFLEPMTLASGVGAGGVVSALRWGIFKGTQTCEAGIGTQTIAHSLADTNDPERQGALAMLSTYVSGFLAFLSGCVALLTETWQDPSLSLGINMVAASFEAYFSVAGLLIVTVCAFLFGFGTILGNSYNGSQFFSYLTDHKKNRVYLALTALLIFVGSTADVQTVWSSVDIVLAFVAFPHMAALLVHTHRARKERKLALQAR